MCKQFLPKRVESLLNIGPVSSVACGLGHTLVLMVSGLVYSWGHGTNGRLGLGHIEDRPTATLVGFGDERVCKVQRLLATLPSTKLKNNRQIETSDRSLHADCVWRVALARHHRQCSSVFLGQEQPGPRRPRRHDGSCNLDVVH